VILRESNEEVSNNTFLTRECRNGRIRKARVIEIRPNKSVMGSSSVKRMKGAMQNEKIVVMLTTRQGRRSKTGETLFLSLHR
jgi:hypothetical protein